MNQWRARIQRSRVNRVLDYAQNGMTRVINAVVPKVNADMVTYSSYDSTAIGNDLQTVQSSLKLAPQTIEKMAPDPMGLGNRRILISEYGLFENQLVGGTTWRAKAILSTASKEGVCGAFLWNVSATNARRPTANLRRWTPQPGILCGRRITSAADFGWCVPTAAPVQC